MKSKISLLLGGINELALVVGMIGILVVLFTPIPPALLDFLLLLNFAAALMILLVTFYTEKPLGFSTFPSLLLMTTLFRLSLNISATRLILSNAHAGKVIDSVGTYVVGGNYVIGLVVFLILIVVQYVVVTNGAQRVAEVAARFTLDSLPGKQMSIDADLNMGIIDQEEAKQRRAQLEKESNFYGAMDGASKFVKGDAIAGIIIILINIIGGLSIGIVQHGMSWQEALHRYTLLTVGDGIVTQIPSLIIAVGTGIIITRAATDTRLGQEISNQFSSHPRAMLIVAAALLLVGLLPGVPLTPVIALALLLGGLAWFAMRKSVKAAVASLEKELLENNAAISTSSDEGSLYKLTTVAPFQLLMGREVAARYQTAASELEQRLDMLRKQLTRELGLVLPQVTVRQENRLTKLAYEIHVYGVNVGSGELDPDGLLAINPGGERVKLEGKETREPTYGLPAQWIAPSLAGTARSAGYTLVEPETVLVTHVQELSKRHAPEFLTRAETERLIDRRRADLGSLIDDLVPTILSYSDIQRVLQQLLKEHVAIHNLEAILEVLADSGRQIKSAEELAERVRERLGSQICEQLRDSKQELHVITLAPELERHLLTMAKQRESGFSLLSPMDLDVFITKIASECEKLMRKGRSPVLLCAPPLRRVLRNMLWRATPHLHLISINEVTYHAKILSAAVVALESAVTQEVA